MDRPAETVCLLAGLAHRVRNLLFALTATTDAMEAGAAPGASERRHLGVLRDHYRKLDDLMADLLVFGQPSAEPFGPVDAAELVTDAVRVAVSCPPVAADVAPGLELPVRRERLVTALARLIEDARHRARPGARVRVTVRPLVASPRPGVELVIDHDGRGFSDRELERLFEPFASRGHGTGLGLAIARRVFREHGGSLRAESRPGGGRMLGWLPAGPAQREAVP